MEVRRLVTGLGSDGKSVFVSIGPAPRTHRYREMPGAAEALVWATFANSAVPNGGQDLTAEVPSFVPKPGGTCLVIMELPPDSVLHHPSFNPVAAGQEFARFNPGIAERMDPAAPGMHATDSIDYVIVLDGQIWALLDDGREELMRAHDVLIQNGTRHAWRNKSDRPAKLAVFLVGAPSGNARSPDQE